MTHWRQGESVPHHVYRQLGDEPDTRPWPDGDPPVATFLDPDDAEMAVRALSIVAEVARDGGCDQWDEPGDQACPEFQADPAQWCPVCRARALCGSGPNQPDPMVVHGSISLERDDGDGELHATCKCGVTATFTDEPDGRSAHAAAREWWQPHQREATDEEDQFGTTCTECLDPLDDAHPYGTNADGDFVHYGCSDDSPTADPVILQHPAGYTLAEQVQAVWDEEGPDGVADAIRRVARRERT